MHLFITNILSKEGGVFIGTKIYLLFSKCISDYRICKYYCWYCIHFGLYWFSHSPFYSNISYYHGYWTFLHGTLHQNILNGLLHFKLSATGWLVSILIQRFVNGYLTIYGKACTCLMSDMHNSFIAIFKLKIKDV